MRRSVFVVMPSDHYRCANYKSNTGSCTAHFIREETLKAIVRQRIFHAPEKVNGKRYQKEDIVFNFVGELHFPTDLQTERKENHEQEKTA